MKRILAVLVVLTLFSAASPAAADKPVPKEGDLFVLLGGTLIEREQRYGYWETVLVCNQPEQQIRVRNLGWSGDTVWGEARAGFDTPREGFRRMIELVRSLQPRMILVAYGTNEAFAGEAGLPRFREGLAALLDALAATKAEVVLLAPLPQEDLGRPLPDPAAYNRSLKSYWEVLREAARQRNLARLDLLQWRPPGKSEDRLTDNGLHLSDYGYWRTGLAWRAGLPAEQRRPTVELAGANRPERKTLPVLPVPLPPPLAPKSLNPLAPFAPVVRARGLPQGDYTLHIDGKPRGSASADAWADGVPLFTGPDYDQVEKLRAAIIEKNQLYFHRWRPQNETYLFGFRKHEQGKNAKEVAEFDALVGKVEVEIARLRVPVAHTYELVPQRKDKP